MRSAFTLTDRVDSETFLCSGSGANPARAVTRGEEHRISGPLLNSPPALCFLTALGRRFHQKGRGVVAAAQPRLVMGLFRVPSALHVALTMAVLDDAPGVGLSAAGQVRFARRTARTSRWCAVEHRVIDWASCSSPRREEFGAWWRATSTLVCSRPLVKENNKFS